MIPTPQHPTQTGSGILDILPNELVGAVFEHAHQDYYYGPIKNDASTREWVLRETWRPEVVVSHVNKLWRRLALALPGLWATCRLKPKHPVQVEREYHRLQTYLSRSIDADLDLYLDLTHSTTHPTVALIPRCTISHIHRLRRFVLLSDRRNDIMPLHQSLAHVSAPCLEHFEVCTGKYHNIAEEGYDSKPHWDPRLFNEGPHNVKYIRLDSPASARFRVPLDNLVHFSLECGTAPLELLLLWVCFEQILALPHLETFSIWGEVIAHPMSSPERLPLQPIEARRLKHIRFGNAKRNVDPLKFILNYVKAPLLESLTIAEVHFYSPIEDPSLNRGNQNPADYFFPSLKSVYLVGVVLGATSRGVDSQSTLLHTLSSRTSKAVHLSITDDTSYGPSDIVDGLRDEGGATRWPGIRRLDYNVFDSTVDADEQSPLDDLRFFQQYWQNLTVIRLPCEDHIQWPGVEELLEDRDVELEMLEDTPSWPPGYADSSVMDGANDPFPVLVDDL